MTYIVITREIATKMRDVVSMGLVRGLGKPEPGKMCVEAAACYVLGLPHGDNPKCVSEAVRALKIRLNDSCWSSNAARAKGMLRLSIVQLGTLDIDDRDFVNRVLAVIKRDFPRFAYAATAATAAYATAATAADADAILGKFAEDVVQILIDMGAPSAQYLDLAPLEGK